MPVPIRLIQYAHSTASVHLSYYEQSKATTSSRPPGPPQQSHTYNTCSLSRVPDPASIFVNGFRSKLLRAHSMRHHHPSSSASNRCAVLPASRTYSLPDYPPRTSSPTAASTPATQPSAAAVSCLTGPCGDAHGCDHSVSHCSMLRHPPWPTTRDAIHP